MRYSGTLAKAVSPRRRARRRVPRVVIGQAVEERLHLAGVPRRAQLPDAGDERSQVRRGEAAAAGRAVLAVHPGDLELRAAGDELDEVPAAAADRQALD